MLNLNNINHLQNNLVSIIMPNYNCSGLIADSINSVKAQTYKNWELIIIDDASTDDSTKIINSFCSTDKRIKLIRNKINSGAAVSRNIGIEISKGRWIAFLDSDDLWVPNKLEIQIKFMLDNGYFFTFGGIGFIDKNGSNILKPWFPKKTCYKYMDILKKNEISCLTAIYDCLAIGKVMMPVEAYKREDYACFLNILKLTEGYSMDNVLGFYRIHNSVSSNKLKMMKYTWHVFRKVEKVNFFKSIVLIFCWAINGLKKYKSSR